MRRGRGWVSLAPWEVFIVDVVAEPTCEREVGAAAAPSAIGAEFDAVGASAVMADSMRFAAACPALFNENSIAGRRSRCWMLLRP